MPGNSQCATPEDVIHKRVRCAFQLANGEPRGMVRP
jgi:hypothetical protein